jgi:hypothetical protein
MSDDYDESGIHARALERYKNIEEVVQDERDAAISDRRFYSIAGAQWEGALKKQFAEKPLIEVNKIHMSVLRIVSEYRNNRMSVDFKSKDGLTNDKLAEVCDGLYRSDEQNSNADEAYDNAFEEAVGGGFGAWRLTTKYEDETDPDDDRQRIFIEPIVDADSSVFFDLQAKRQDKRDARECFVLSSMTRDSFIEEWDMEPTTWPKSFKQNIFDVDDLNSSDIIYVAEYYCIEKEKSKIHIWETLSGEELRIPGDEFDKEKARYLKATGATKVGVKSIYKNRVRKYILDGSHVLEDCGYIAGDSIPIVPVYGKRWYIDNIERSMGHVRLAKDSQRLFNMQLSRLAEINSLSSIEKPIFLAEQMLGHQAAWEEDNVKNYPYMLINKVKNAAGDEIATGPMGYTKPPQIPAAMAALMEITDRDMQDVLGAQSQGEKVEGNISTETAMLFQNRIDMQAYIYMSNMAKAMKRCGEIWLGMARDVFIEEGRKLKVIGSQKEIDQIEIMRPIINKEGQLAHENDLSNVRLDVVSEVGPSSSTKKASTVRTLLAMLKVVDDPGIKKVLTSMMVLNIEGEGVEDVKEYIRINLVREGVFKPTEEEEKQLKEEAENAKESSQDEYLRAAADAEKARGVKAQADTILTQAKADETRVKTAEIIVDMGGKKQDQALKTIESLTPRVLPPDLPGSKVKV